MNDDLSTQFFATLNRRGFIPGPGEIREQFLLRIKENTSFLPEEVYERLRPFDTLVDWVPISYSNKGLSPWQAGATWIENHSVQVQLRANFAKKKRLLGFYHWDEIVAHEYLHAARMAFPPSKYEEMLVGLMEKSTLKRLLRSLISRSWESWLLIGLIFFSFLAIPSLLLFPEWTVELGMIITLPYFFIIGLFIRQSWRLLRIVRCFKALQHHLVDPTCSLAFLFRLTDEEIEQFGRWDQRRLSKYMQEEPSLRWQVIRAAYELRTP